MAPLMITLHVSGASTLISLVLPPTAPSSASLSPKAAALTQQLDRLDQDLATTEEGMLSRLRSPLSRTDPASDLAGRLREQEVATCFNSYF